MEVELRLRDLRIGITITSTNKEKVKVKVKVGRSCPNPRRCPTGTSKYGRPVEAELAELLSHPHILTVLGEKKMDAISAPPPASAYQYQQQGHGQGPGGGSRLVSGVGEPQSIDPFNPNPHFRAKHQQQHHDVET